MSDDSEAAEEAVGHKVDLVARLRRRGDFFSAVGSPSYARDVIEAADEIERLRQVWEDTRVQRDELLAHLAGKAPLPQWAAAWLKA